MSRRRLTCSLPTPATPPPRPTSWISRPSLAAAASAVRWPGGRDQGARATEVACRRPLPRRFPQLQTPAAAPARHTPEPPSTQPWQQRLQPRLRPRLQSAAASTPLPPHRRPRAGCGASSGRSQPRPRAPAVGGGDLWKQKGGRRQRGDGRRRRQAGVTTAFASCALRARTNPSPPPSPPPPPPQHTHLRVGADGVVPLVTRVTGDVLVGGEMVVEQADGALHDIVL
jgi:hypothetical protein